jgi:pilus assembly protein CpaB
MFATIPPRRLILLAAAMGLSLITALVVRGWVDNVRREATPAPVTETVKPPTMILVASQALPAGHFIRDEDLKWQSWPDDNMAAAYLVQGAVNTDAVTGAVVRNGIGAGEPITNERIVKKGDRGFLAAIVTPGFRAITVALTTTNAGLSGLAIPGDRIDLLLTMSPPGSGQNTPEHEFTSTVMQDVRVLAIDQKLDDQSSDALMAHTVTLEVTPKQAEAVTLMQDVGKLSMTLRSLGTAENDAEPHQPTSTSESDLSDFLGLAHPKAVPSASPSPSPVEQIEVVRGTSRSLVDISGHVIKQDAQAPAPVSAPLIPMGATPVTAPKAVQRAGQKQ